MADDVPVPDPGQDDRKKKKKADKQRGAWISFAGRIVAQVVGAIASVMLGVFVLQKTQAPAPSATATPSPAADAGRAAGTARRPGEATLAVLPLANLSGRPDQEYFVEGMAEALTASLAGIDGLRVISRTSTMRYKTDPPPIPEIARALGADLLIEGSVLQADGNVRITAQLIDGATDEHLWAQSYTRPLKDVIALQDAVATAIATEIKGTVSRRPVAGAAGTAADHPIDSAVYDLYLRGRHAWYQRTPEALQTALRFFEQAAAADPEFALAHVGIADTYVLQNSPSMPLDVGRDRLEKARQAAMRALDLNGGLAEAHTALAGVIFFGDRNLADAEPKLRRAIELNPNYPVAHEWLGLLLGELGRVDEALTHVDVAIRLDPFEATMYQARGMVQYGGRRYAEAIVSERRALDLTPQLPLARVLLAKSFVMAGRAGEALDDCRRLTAAAVDIDLRIVCVVAATRAGQPALAAQWRQSIAAGMGAVLAQMDAGAGDFAAAWPRLRALAERGALPPVLLTDPMFEGLRREADWAGILATHQARRPVPPRPPRPPGPPPGGTPPRPSGAR